MRASQELRWKQSIKENEERRRRYEEASRRIENEQRFKAQEVLQRRRLERARMDELMRNPAQQPAPPTKPILRKGAGAVLRTQATATAAGSHAASQPPAGTGPTPSDRGRPEHEGQRREWREGLKEYIARQREALKAAGVGQDGNQADALSWQELKLAAEAGFEELLRHQEAAAAASQQPGSATNTRCPGMLRPKGGGAVIKPPAAPFAAAAADAGVLPAVMPAPQPSAATAAQRCSQSGSSSHTSKWALRMKQMLDKAMQNTSAGPACIPSTAAALPPWDQVHMKGQQRQWFKHQELLGTEAEQQQLSLSLQPQTDAAESEAPVAAEEGSCNSQIDVAEVLANEQMACVDTPEMQAGGESPHRDSSSHSAARSPGAGSIQQMSASAQIATAALRESMEKLHRATDVMLSAAWHSQNAATITTSAASRSGTPAPEGGRGSTCLSSPVLYKLQAVAERCNADAVVVRYGAAGCLLDTIAARPASNQLTGAHSNGSSPQLWLGAEAIASSSAEPYHTHHSVEVAAAVIPTLNGCMSDANSEVLGPSECLHVADQTQDIKLKHIEEQPKQQQEVEQLETMQQLQQVEQQFNYAQQHIGQAEGQQSHQPLQQYSAGATEPGMIQPETAASEFPLEVARDDWHATTQQQQQQQLAAAKAASGVDTPYFPAAADPQQQGAAEYTTAGPTLNSLLAEVQQLAALRKALKAEFVAMGHGNVAAAMGTLGLSKDNSLSTSQLQPLQQLQSPVIPQEPARQQQVGQSVQEQDGLHNVEPLAKLPVGHLTEQTFSMYSVRQQETAQQAVCGSAEQQLISRLPETKVMPAPEQGPIMPMAVNSEAAAVVVGSSSREQTLSQLHTEQQADEVLVQQQTLVQQPPAASESMLHWSNTDPRHHQQCPAADNSCPSAAKSATGAPNDPELAASDDQQSVTSLSGSTGKSGLVVTLAGAPMDLSFSFGIAAAQQQHDLSQSASPQLMPVAKQVVLQLEPSNSAISMQACTQQEHQQLDLASWQKQRQQQQPAAVQWPAQQAVSAKQAQQTRLQRQQLGHQAPQPNSSMNQTAVEQAHAPLPALLQWNVPAHIKEPAAAAALPCVQAQAAPVMPMHLGLNGVPSVLPAGVPQVPYIPQQAEFTNQFVPVIVQPAAVMPVKPCSSSSSSSTPTQRSAVVSSWITGSPTSSRRGSPLPSPGRIGALAAAAARKPAPSSPTTAGAKCGGSGFLGKLSRQYSSSRNSPATSGVASAAGKPTSAGGGAARGLPAAERQLVNQGSYLTAALQAKQRMEKDHSERQRVEAVAAAAKQAAARKLQEEWEAQQLAAAHAGRQVAPAAMCSYAHSGTAEQEYVSHARSPVQPSSSFSTPQHASCTQPSPPAAQNSSPSPPRRVVRAASIKQVSAAGRPMQPAASSVARNSNPGSGLSTPSQPAARIPSAPGTPLAKPASPTLPAAQQRPIGVQPPDCGTGTSGARGLADSCDSDFDHLERELNGVNDKQMINTNMPRSRSHVVGTQQAFVAATVPLTNPTPVVRVQKAFEAAVAAAATGNKQGMWVAEQAAAAAAMNSNAAKQQHAPPQQAPAVAASGAIDSRAGGVRPARLHIPASTARSVAATPAPVTAASTATAAAKPRIARTPSPVPSRQAQQQASSGQQQQQQQRQISGARSATPPKGPGTVKEQQQPFASAAPATDKASAAAANACMLEVHRLSLEEAELLASLQQLDNMQAQVKQQTAYGGHAPAPVAVASGIQVGPQSAEWHCKAAPGQSAKQKHGAPFSARAGSNIAGITVAGSRRGQHMLGSPIPDVSRSALPTSSGQTAAGAVSKLPIPSPNKAKEQRETKLAAARAPAAGVPFSRTLKPKETPTAEAALTNASAAAAGPMHAADVMSVGWLNPCQPCDGYIPVQPGQQYPQMPMPGGYTPPGFGHPAMAWCDMDAARQQPHGLGPHAVAALAAAAPAHFQQPGQFGMYAPQGPALGSINHVYPGQGIAQPLLCGQQQQQQQQMYWAAMQAQQYQQWRQQQQQLGVVYPGTAGGVMGYSRPGTGALSQLQPPLSAPGGSQYMPGSPLLPTLQYQQTVMRNRTSTAGDSGGSSSGRSSDAGCGVLSARNIGAIGKGHAMGWQQQHPGNADVWPPRGVEKVHAKGTVVAGNGRQGERGETGTVHVYKPGLLL